MITTLKDLLSRTDTRIEEPHIVKSKKKCLIIPLFQGTSMK